jgi:hypothetical protein
MNDLMEDFDITGQSILVSADKLTVIIYEPILDHQGIYRFVFRKTSAVPTKTIVTIEQWFEDVKEGYERYEDDVDTPLWFREYQKKSIFKYQLRSFV